jgi:hypothetical protein
LYPEPIDLGGLASWLASAFGFTNPVMGSIMAVCILFGIIMVPMALLKIPSYITIIVLAMFTTVFTMLGWIPVFAWLFIGLFAAFTVSGKMKGWF